ncbi:hypothetical protein H1R20_g14125, partial [Candolleomyces eurysporus]
MHPDLDLPELATCTTCRFKEDLSNYWTAVMYFKHSNGSYLRVPQIPNHYTGAPEGGMTIYYIQPPGNGPENKVTAFPKGFRMITGNPMLRSKRTDIDPTSPEAWALSFRCWETGDFFGPDNSFAPGAGPYDTVGLPTKMCPTGIRANIFFPSCWDGKTLDTPDHHSHVAFLQGKVDPGRGIFFFNGTCPSTHPVRVPLLFYETYWATHLFKDVWPTDGSQPLVLSMGDPTGYGQHGDYVFGWEGDSLQRAMDNCRDAFGWPEACSSELTILSDEEINQCLQRAQVDEDTGESQFEDLKQFYKAWLASWYGPGPSDIPEGTRHPQIKCLGIFDYVDIEENLVSPSGARDQPLPRSVQNTFHALALHENRALFNPKLLTIPGESIDRTRVFRQIWFPGSHSDVGGGYEFSDLSHIPLIWMAGEIAQRDLFSLDLDFILQTRKITTGVWAGGDPHDAYDETPFLLKAQMGLQDRLKSGDILSTDLFHSSVLTNATYIFREGSTPTKTILKFTDLVEKFESGWTPRTLPLSPFEERCKQSWGTAPIIPGPICEVVRNDLYDYTSTVYWVTGSPASLAQRKDLVKGGVTNSGQQAWVARAKYQNVLYPGYAFSDFSAAHIGYEGNEVLVNEFEALACVQAENVEWIQVPGLFDLGKLRGATPVIGGYDANKLPIFIAKGLVPKGTTLAGKPPKALIPYAGSDRESTDYWTYSVLVHNTKTFQIAQLGAFQSGNDWTVVPPNFWNTFTFDTSTFHSTSPSFFIGLRYIDLGTHIPSMGVKAYVEESFNQHTCKIGPCPAANTLFNGGLDWLVTDITPEFQMGVLDTAELPHMPNPPVAGIGNVVHKIEFKKPYPATPKVIVCLTGFETSSSTRCSLKAYATDIDRRGFTLNITTGSNEVRILFATVNWIAVAEDLPSIAVGGFSTENETQGNLSNGGRVEFGRWFKRPPKVFIGLNGFDCSGRTNMRLNTKVEEIQVDGMRWKFEPWADTALGSASAAFLAIEMPEESRE